MPIMQITSMEGKEDSDISAWKKIIRGKYKLRHKLVSMWLEVVSFPRNLININNLIISFILHKHITTIKSITSKALI
jgi:hypothetical protein